jgi:hypothetical protein
VDRVFAYDPEFRATALTLAGDLRNVTIRYLPPGIGARVAGWVLLAAVAVVTTVWYRRRAAGGPAGRAGAALLFASGLTVPHLYFYDETVFLLPLLVLWSHRAALAGWRFVVLIVLTAGFYLAPKAIFAVPWGPSGPPPLMTLAAVALWLLSLLVRTEGSVS